MRAQEQVELGLNQPKAPSITGIEVRNLFGYLSYDIGSRRSRYSADALILYGENGSGKTTVLRLLFYLLSPADSRGHKSVVARTVFSRFSVYFDTGIAVNAIRPGTELTGGFAMTISSEARLLHEFTFRTQPGGGINIGDPEEHQKLGEFYEQLKKLGITLFFLKDDRSIESTLFDNRRDEDELALQELRERRFSLTAITVKAVRSALSRATMFIRTQVFRATNRGDTDTYNVYLEIIRRIAAASGGGDKKRSSSVSSLLKKLGGISERSERLGSLGLISRVDVRELLALLKKMPRDRTSIAEQVVLPYVNSTTARFDALERVATALEKFLSYLNKFYRGKTIFFDLHEGFLIHNPAGQNLTANMLSSGEKHLLLLFCNVLVAEEFPSLFIIDEPELSLNIRWQRLLINALLDCVEGTEVRFVFATHSIEMLSQHRKKVHKLEPLGSRSIHTAPKDEGNNSDS